MIKFSLNLFHLCVKIIFREQSLATLRQVEMAQRRLSKNYDGSDIL